MYCRQGATCGGKWGACSGSSALGGWGGGGRGWVQSLNGCHGAKTLQRLPALSYGSHSAVGLILSVKNS